MDPEDFFPQRGQDINEAMRACFQCEVRSECEHYRASTGSDYGVWGGKLRLRTDEDEGV